MIIIFHCNIFNCFIEELIKIATKLNYILYLNWKHNSNIDIRRRNNLLHVFVCISNIIYLSVIKSLNYWKIINNIIDTYKAIYTRGHEYYSKWVWFWFILKIKITCFIYWRYIKYFFIKWEWTTEWFRLTREMVRNTKESAISDKTNSL